MSTTPTTKFISIDIETTGLDPEKHQILEIAAIIDDLAHPEIPTMHLPAFRRVIRYEEVRGNNYALSMHGPLLREIATKDDYDPELVTENFIHGIDKQFKMWCVEHDVFTKNGNVIAAGKNFMAFDFQFLKRLPNWTTQFHHRVLDPALYYWKPEEDGALLPNMQTCIDRMGLPGATQTPHTAYGDALMVIHLIRYGINKQKFTYNL